MTKRTERKARPTVDVPGRNVVIDARGYVYYYTRARWDKERKRGSDDRVCIGKLADPPDRSRMVPNGRYYELFPELELPPSCSEELSVGGYLAVRGALETVGALGALRSAFPDLWAKVLSLAVYACCEESLVSYRMAQFCFRSFAGRARPLSAPQISELYAQIGEDREGCYAFLRAFGAGYASWAGEAAPGASGRRAVGFDSTNCGTAAAGIPIAEWGHAKGDGGLPVVGTAYWVDEGTGIPVWYEQFAGSLIDRAECGFAFAEGSRCGLGSVFLMVDRGYFSAGNVRRLSEGGSEFGASLPRTRLADELFGRCAGIKGSQAASIEGSGAFGERVDGIEVGGRAGLFAYVFYDPETALVESAAIDAAIAAARAQAEAMEYYSGKAAASLPRWVRVSKRSPGAKKSRCVVEVDAEYCQRQRDRAGMFAVVSNAEMSAAEMLAIVRGRDAPEKSFRRKKWGLDGDAPRVHGMAALQGKGLVEFVANVAMSSLAYLAGDVIKKTPTRTVAEAMDHLQTCSVAKRGGRWVQRYALTKFQKDVFGRVGIDCGKIESIFAEAYV